MKAETLRQKRMRKLVNAIARYQATHGYAPSVRELMEASGFSSPRRCPSPMAPITSLVSNPPAPDAGDVGEAADLRRTGRVATHPSKA